MQTIVRFLACSTIAVLIIATAAMSFAGPNVYPDPSFEQTGVPGVARTGEKAGHLAVGAMDHWSAIGGAVRVQPFARYRVTEWVKANVGNGSFFAPYCYEWDSYEWAFVSQATIKSCSEWTRSAARR